MACHECGLTHGDHTFLYVPGFSERLIDPISHVPLYDPVTLDCPSRCDIPVSRHIFEQLVATKQKCPFCRGEIQEQARTAARMICALVDELKV